MWNQQLSKLSITRHLLQVTCAAIALHTIASMAHAQAIYTAMRVARHAAVTAIPAGNWPPAFAQATTAFQQDNGTLDLPCTLQLDSLDTGWWYSGAGTNSSPNTQAQVAAAIDKAAPKNYRSGCCLMCDRPKCARLREMRFEVGVRWVLA